MVQSEKHKDKLDIERLKVERGSKKTHFSTNCKKIIFSISIIKRWFKQDLRVKREKNDQAVREPVII